MKSRINLLSNPRKERKLMNPYKWYLLKGKIKVKPSKASLDLFSKCKMKEN